MNHKIIGILGVPTDLGASKVGASLGPAAIRAAGLHEIKGFTNLLSKPEDLHELRAMVNAGASRGFIDFGDILVPKKDKLRSQKIGTDQFSWLVDDAQNIIYESNINHMLDNCAYNHFTIKEMLRCDIRIMKDEGYIDKFDTFGKFTLYDILRIRYGDTDKLNHGDMSDIRDMNTQNNGDMDKLNHGDMSNIRIMSKHGDTDKYIGDILDPIYINAKNFPEIFITSLRTRHIIYNMLLCDYVPLVISGDHSAAIGIIAGMSSYYYHLRNQRIGVIWFDAHADINTVESSPSGNVHGMPLAACLGLHSEISASSNSRSFSLSSISSIERMIEANNTVLIGCRDIDDSEWPIIIKNNIKVFTMADINRLGIEVVINQAIEIATKNTVGFHLEFDVDGVDPQYIPGTGTTVPGGVSYREVMSMLEIINQSKKLTSAHFTEINPLLDNSNQSSKNVVNFIKQLFTSRI